MTRFKTSLRTLLLLFTLFATLQAWAVNDLVAEFPKLFETGNHAGLYAGSSYIKNRLEQNPAEKIGFSAEDLALTDYYHMLCLKTFQFDKTLNAAPVHKAMAAAFGDDNYMTLIAKALSMPYEQTTVDYIVKTAIPAIEEQVGEEAWEIGYLIAQAGDVYANMGDMPKAISMLDAANCQHADNGRATSWFTMLNHMQLAYLKIVNDNFKVTTGEPDLNKSLDLDKVLSEGDVIGPTINSHYYLMWMMNADGQSQSVIDFSKGHFQMMEVMGLKDTEPWYVHQYTIGNCYVALGNKKEAAKIFADVKAGYERLGMSGSDAHQQVCNRIEWLKKQ